MRKLLCWLGFHKLKVELTDKETELVVYVCAHCKHVEVHDVSHWHGIGG